MSVRMPAGGARGIATGMLLRNSCCWGGSIQCFCHAHGACQLAHSLVVRAATPPADCLRSAAAQAAANSASAMLFRMSMRMRDGGARGFATGMRLTNSCCLGGSKQHFDHAHCAGRLARPWMAGAALPMHAAHEQVCPGGGKQRLRYAQYVCQRALSPAVRAASPQACR